MNHNEETEFLAKFLISTGLTTAEAEVLLAKYGRNELPEKKIPKWYIFLSLLWQPMPIMIWVASIIELIISNYLDMGILIFINLANASLSFYETNKAGDAIKALKASTKPTTVCFRDGKWNPQFDARLLVPGDLIELSPGSAVPADCMINEGQIEVDESAVTGESLAASIGERQMAKMGGTVVNGDTHATVIFTGKDTVYGKTAALLIKGDRQSNLQKLLIRIMIILCILSIILCLTALFYLLFKQNINLTDSISFAVVLLVASIPMAVEIVTTATLAIGSKVLTQHGAIVSRLASIEDLAGMTMLCSDKTGTLTKNKMTIHEETPVYQKDLTQLELLKYAALGCKWESPPKDALDTLFLRCPLWFPGSKQALQAWNSEHPNATIAERQEWENEQISNRIKEALIDYEMLGFVPFNPKSKKTESTIRVKSTGNIFKVTKGAPHIIQKMDKDQEKEKLVHHKLAELGEDGIRAVAIAITDPINHLWKEGVKPEEQHIECEWNLIGLLTFLDPPREDTKDTIIKAQALGVPVRMITGDNILIAKKTCRDLGMGAVERQGWPNIQGPDHLPHIEIDSKSQRELAAYGEYIKEADGFAQVYPEHKFLIVECYRQMGYKVGMTGDGVNDAPALKNADVGIAVAGATDAARAASSIVLTKEGLGTIIIGIGVARCIFARMKSFLTYRIAATLQLLTFFFIAVFAFKPSDYIYHDTPDPEAYPNYFSLPVIYLMIITVINDGTLISIGYDNVVPSKYPERWILPALFIISIGQAIIACGSSLLLLYFCLTSYDPNGLFQAIGIDGLSYGQIVNTIFLKVAISDILSLFSCRTGNQFFFKRRPHKVLVICVSIALMLSTTLALSWPCEVLTTVPVCGLARVSGQLIALWTWLYCIVVFVIQDVIKVVLWKILIRYNLFNVQNVIKSKKVEKE